MTPKATPNPDMLVIAREARELTQLAVAKGMGIQQPLLSMYEHALRVLPDEQVSRVSALTRFPEPFFFIAERRHGFASPCPTFYRKRAATTARGMKRIQAWANIFRIHIERLLRGIDLEEHVPHYDMLDPDMSPERAAALTRTAFALPQGPIKNLIEMVEACGIIVLRLDFGTTRIDAVSHWPRGYRPLILLNALMPPDRMRLSLAHELGHLVQHHPTATGDSEAEADRFAAELLMPAAEIKGELRKIDLPRLAHLKQCWGVSMQALLVRSHRLEAIGSSTYKRLCIEISRRGFRRHEPVEIPDEQPTFLRSVVQRHLGRDRLTLDQIGQMLAMHGEEVRSIYLPEPRRPRIAW